MRPGTPQDILRLDDGWVDLRSGRLHRGEQEVALTTTQLHLLRYLAQRPSEELSDAELRREVWGHQGRLPGRGPVPSTVRRLRQLLEPDPSEPRYILTVHGVGYRFEPPSARTSVVIGAAGHSPDAPYHPDWHIPRPEAEAAAARNLSGPGAPVVVVGAPQMGKSWFVEHLLHQHGSAGDQWLRLQPPREGAEPRVIVEGEGSVSATHEALTEWLAGQLSAASGRVFVVLDALERWPAIEGVSVQDLVRSWARQGQPPWERLRLITAAGTEAVVRQDLPDLSSTYALRPIYLEDLPLEAVRAFVSAHLPAWSAADLAELQALVGGHPWLLRVAFYESQADRSPAAVLVAAAQGAGPFGQWLRRQLRTVLSNPEAAGLVRQVLDDGTAPVDYLLAHRLERAAILAPEGRGWRVRYPLLESFLAGKL